MFAQFDFPPGTDSSAATPTDCPECFGWHLHAADEFEPIPPPVPAPFYDDHSPFKYLDSD